MVDVNTPNGAGAAGESPVMDPGTLLAYVEDELDPAARAVLEAALVDQPEIRGMLADLVADRETLRSLPEPAAGVGAAERAVAVLERQALFGEGDAVAASPDVARGPAVAGSIGLGHGAASGTVSHAASAQVVPGLLTGSFERPTPKPLWARHGLRAAAALLLVGGVLSAVLLMWRSGANIDRPLAQEAVGIGVNEEVAMAEREAEERRQRERRERREREQALAEAAKPAVTDSDAVQVAAAEAEAAPSALAAVPAVPAVLAESAVPVESVVAATGSDSEATPPVLASADAAAGINADASEGGVALLARSADAPVSGSARLEAPGAEAEQMAAVPVRVEAEAARALAPADIAEAVPAVEAAPAAVEVPAWADFWNSPELAAVRAASTVEADVAKTVAPELPVLRVPVEVRVLTQAPALSRRQLAMAVNDLGLVESDGDAGGVVYRADAARVAELVTLLNGESAGHHVAEVAAGAEAEGAVELRVEVVPIWGG